MRFTMRSTSSRQREIVILALAVLPLSILAQQGQQVQATGAPAAGPRFTFTPAPIGAVAQQPPPTTAPIDDPNLFIFAPAVLTNAPITNAPVRAPTPAPIAAVTAAPIRAPTNFPVVAPTNAPLVAPTTNAPTTASPTTVAPTTVAPTTMGPTRMPALTPVTEVPTIAPSVQPSVVPTSLAPSTSTPTGTTLAPVDPLQFVRQDENVQHVTITYPGVGNLDFVAEEVYSDEVSPWFDAYFVKNRRRLQQSFGIRNMVSHVDFSDQEVTDTGNTITYTQSISYEANSNAPPPQEIVKLPFQDASYRQELVPILRNRVPGFGTWTGVVAAPSIVEPRGPENPVKEETFFSPAIISGIAGGGILLCGIVGVMLYCCMKNQLKHKDYGKAEEQPPDQFQFSNASEDGISVMDEPLTKPAGLSTDGASLGGYGDQSVATVDYDYSKAYGGGAASVVSSVGGTLGDTTRLTAENAVGSTRAALGANTQDVRQQGGVQEEVIIIEAPPGKLGVVIDTPDDGAPLVHAVKDSSVIADQICVGDKLVAVDNDDVRSMTAIKVSKLISKRSSNPSRRLTIVRTIHAG